MPDLRAGETYARRLDKLMRRYSRAVSAQMDQARLALLDELLTTGLDRAAFGRAVERELGDLTREARRIGRSYRGELDEATAAFARKQVDEVRQVDPSAPDFDTILAMTGGEREALLAMLEENPQWITALRAQLLFGLNRLSASDTDVRAAANRLLSQSIKDGRASVWRVGQNDAMLATEDAVWNLANSLLASDYRVGNEQSKREWQKQAVAAIDEKTTQTCLLVHGQIQSLDKPFHLTGTPRFADYMQGPPFHWRCRTATTLYLVEFEEVGVPTDEMRDAARAELNARETTGRRVEIHPAHATSRRS